MLHSEIIINQGYSGFNPVQFGYEQCAPSYGFGPAVRSFWLLHYVVSGQGIFERGGETYCLSKGDIFVIPPLLETYYCADRNEPLSYMWVGFTADNIPNDILSSAVIHLPIAGRIFQDMRRCAEMGNGKSAYLSAKIWELVSMLLEDGTTVPSHIDKALNIIHSEYANGITIASLAERLNLDRTYFSSLFKKNMGVSAMDYLSAIRLNKAAELISKYGKSPTTAALSVGYGDYCHFSKAFKKQFGCSPRYYVEK